MIDRRYEAELCSLIQELARKGYLSCNRFGAVSLYDRAQGVMYISPAPGVHFRINDWKFLRPEDIAAVDGGGRPLKELAPAPAEEYKTHLALYKARASVNAAAHIQSVYVSAFAACCRDMCPVMVEDVKTMIGGEDGVIRSARKNGCLSDAFTAAVLEGLSPDKKAVFLPFNGAICMDSDSVEAFSICTILERQSQMEVDACSLGNIDYIDLDMTIDESIRPIRKKTSEGRDSDVKI